MSLLTVAMVAASAVGFVGCGGGDASTSTTTSISDAETTSLDPLAGNGADPATTPNIRVFSDPSQTISVDVGEQFAIVLEADPASGNSWQAIGYPDPAMIVVIGSEFRSPDVLAVPTTSVVVDSTDTTGAVPPSTEAAKPAATQVMRYGARSPGTTAIKLRYGPPGSLSTDDKSVTFSVVVFDSRIPTTTAPPIDPLSTTTLAAKTTQKTLAPKPKTTTTSAARTTTTK